MNVWKKVLRVSGYADLGLAAEEEGTYEKAVISEYEKTD